MKSLLRRMPTIPMEVIRGFGESAALPIIVCPRTSASSRRRAFLRFNSFDGDSEDNYLGGARYLTRRFGRLQPYAQGLAGLGRIQYPFGIPAGRYFALAPGAGASYSIARKWSVRGEYEYQVWLNWPNISGYPAQSFTPNGFHVGVAYRLF